MVVAHYMVYNSENRFVGFFYQFTCRVKRTKGLEDKTEFWDRLMTSDHHPVINLIILESQDEKS